jgi:hypothetical protein
MSTHRYALALTPVIPIRTEPREGAEMESQLLFGELMSILETTERWLRIRSEADGSQGWIDRKMATEVTPDYVDWLRRQPQWVCRLPIADLHVDGSNRVVRISMGSTLPGYNPASGRFTVGALTFRLPLQSAMPVGDSHLRALLRTAELFVNTPYLWGGRNIFGLDCSGFVQVVFAMHGIRLPRNAREQALEGVPVASLAEAYPGDLVFFANDAGRITHVGILVAPDRILHCSGDVHVDPISPEGIRSERLGRLTHGAPQLRRLTQLSRRPTV